jgi:hypothetical protein
VTFQDSRTFLARVGQGVANAPEPAFQPLTASTRNVSAAGFTEQTILINENSQSLLGVAGSNWTYPSVQNSLNLSGKALYYAIDGSSAPLRLNLTIGSLNVTNFGPGQILRMPFSSVQVGWSPEGCSRGYARLIAVQDPESFEEYRIRDVREGRSRATPLAPYAGLTVTNAITGFGFNSSTVGLNSAAINYASTPISLNMYCDVNTMRSDDRLPDVRGWTRVRWGIVGNVSPGTALTVIPWFGWCNKASGFPTDTSGWWQQLQGQMSLAYTGAAMNAQQVVTFDLLRIYPPTDPSQYDIARGIFMFLECRDNTAGASYKTYCEGLA